MKKFLVGMMAIGVVFGVFAAESAIYAGEGKSVQSEEPQSQDRQEAARWEVWRADFASALEADEEYQGAKAAVDARETADEQERAGLEAVRDSKYREIALAIYEEHFGMWDGSEDEFDDVLKAETNPVDRCTNNALRACGAGKVCWVKSGTDSCLYSCQDATGSCHPVPTG